MQMLPTFGAKGEALGINNAGRIVGFAIKMTDRTEIHAVLWTRDGEMVDLYPATGFHEAKEITDDGWILFDQSGVARLRGNPE
jgi:probable HAF family extracellular repeat protein